MSGTLGLITALAALTGVPPGAVPYLQAITGILLFVGGVVFTVTAAFFVSSFKEAVVTWLAGVGLFLLVPVVVVLLVAVVVTGADVVNSAHAQMLRLLEWLVGCVRSAGEPAVMALVPACCPLRRRRFNVCVVLSTASRAGERYVTTTLVSGPAAVRLMRDTPAEPWSPRVTAMSVFPRHRFRAPRSPRHQLECSE